MLRIYRLPNGRTYQFEEGEQPDGAVVVETAMGVTTPEGRKAPEGRRKAPAKKSQG